MEYLIKSLVLVLALVTASANADTISGDLEMTGGFFAVDKDGNNTSDASQAVTINFDIFNSDAFRASSPSGDYSGSGIVEGAIGSITDFQFDTSPSAFSPIANFWTIGIFSFELESIVKATSSSSDFLALNGTGVVTADGFDPTDTSWNFSGDTSGGGLFGWSTTPSNPAPSTAVPEPSILVLLSIGLLGFVLRKKF